MPANSAERNSSAHHKDASEDADEDHDPEPDLEGHHHFPQRQLRVARHAHLKHDEERQKRAPVVQSIAVSERMR